MSGWDEGGVYYSNLTQFTDASPEAEVPPHRPLRVAIRNFEKEKNVFPYRESLVNNPKFLVVNPEDHLSFHSDLLSFDPLPPIICLCLSGRNEHRNGFEGLAT
ncbi:minichromosome maintenance 5 protein [Gossypium australe]|uniref:Minichromosome maintenance 5 protein n=1 Tax=Gossypium australe TaxID=47621 RepID=A0A5B6XAS0_9ROSI|nr:minichromosome maintenance 5 protein [Gossypium australe]